MKTLFAVVVMAFGLSLFAKVAQLPESQEESYSGYWVEIHGVYTFFTEDEVIKTL